MKAKVTKEKLSLNDRSVYFVYGTWKKEASAEVILNGAPLEYESSVEEYFDATQRFILSENDLENIVLKVLLPEPLPSGGTLKIYCVYGTEKELWFSCPVSALRNKQCYIQYIIERITVSGGSIKISGWAASEKDNKIRVYGKDGRVINAECKRYKRPDVNNSYTECDVAEKCGFEVEIPDPSIKYIELEFSQGSYSVREKISLGKGALVLKKFRQNAEKAMRVIRSDGIRALPGKISLRMKHIRTEVDYDTWIAHHIPSEEVLEKQRNTHFDYAPLFSVLVPLYKTPEEFLKKMIDSVKAQTYSNWELVLSDGSGSPSPISEALKAEAASDKRIKVLEASEPFRIVENTNRAVMASSGDFIALLDHDDELTPDALFECAKAVNENRDISFIYSDEDKINVVGNKFFQPNMKPDFNPDLLRSVNYICHLTVIRRDLLDKAGLLDPSYEGAQDYDLILRCTELSEGIHHIPRVLYHWRSHEASTAENPESKMYAFEAGKRALEAHFKRLGIPAEVYHNENHGLYRIKYLRDRDPLISILIPNKDHVDDLKRCIDSIEEKSTYRNYEYIIIENNSTEEETFRYYKELEKTNPKAHVVYYKGSFNFSDINNFGEMNANGEYLLLLNNDTELINGESIEDMLAFCMREEVGCVGARLYYGDDTIQHAGVIIGFGSIAGHCFVQIPHGDTGYQDRIICAADYSAVTAACMMVDREVFRKVGGFETSLAVAFNDVDLCLKIRKEGYLIVYDPYAQLHHYESKSRGLEDTPEKVARFNTEIETIQKRWPDILREGDPYYNRNLSLETQDFSLARNY